jgi:hypothetical protein
MLETPDYPVLSRVMRVQPRPDEKPASGFSWADYEDVHVDSGTGSRSGAISSQENDADADGDGEEDDNGGWGVVKSRRSSTSSYPLMSKYISNPNNHRIKAKFFAVPISLPDEIVFVPC